MMQHGLTIVVPVFNRASYLPRLVEAMLSSDHRPLSIVLVDNGSTDGSRQICSDLAKHYSSQDVDIRVIDEPRSGAPAARNTGLSICVTEYVYFFDTDDDFSTHFVCRVMSELESHTDIDMLCCPVMMECNGHRFVRAHEPSASVEAHILSSMLDTQSMVFRTTWLRSIGGWPSDVDIWQDWLLGLRALLHNPRLCWLPGSASHVIHVHPNSITGSDFSSRSVQSLATMRLAMDEVAADSGREDIATLFLSLSLRAAIMSGHLLREGDVSGSQAYDVVTTDCLRAASAGVRGRWVRFVGRCLRLYTRHGGRGAWRLALWAVRIGQ